MRDPRVQSRYRRDEVLVRCLRGMLPHYHDGVSVIHPPPSRSSSSSSPPASADEDVGRAAGSIVNATAGRMRSWDVVVVVVIVGVVPREDVVDLGRNHAHDVRRASYAKGGGGRRRRVVVLGDEAAFGSHDFDYGDGLWFVLGSLSVRVLVYRYGTVQGLLNLDTYSTIN